MEKRRYQVFVSSTYEDLQEERQEVMHALLELDCIPSGMELFPAANETQWEVIKRVIEDCDYYVLILGGRYGTCGADGIGYTEMEYRYALEIEKPIIAFLHGNPSTIAAGRSEKTDQGHQKLAAFRALVEQKLCKYWSSAPDLGSVVTRSLVHLIRTAPATGWIRADEMPEDATVEILKLRRRVEELQSQLARARTTPPVGSENLARGEDLYVLRYRFVTHRNVSLSARLDWQLNGKEFEEPVSQDREFQATWNSIFSAIGPMMINEAPDGQLKASLDRFAAERNSEYLKELAESQNLVVTQGHLNEDDFQTIKVQFRALGLIAKSEKPRSIKDTTTYWALTPYGDNIMTRLLAIKRAEDPTKDAGVALV